MSQIHGIIMTNHLLILTRENDRYRELIGQHDLNGLILLDDAPDNIQLANIWLAEPGLAAPLIPHAKNLKWLQSTFAGVDKLMHPRARKDYQLTNIRGIFGPLMSEYLFGYLLAHNKQHALYRDQQAKQLWQQGQYGTLQGQTLLLLGTGSISQHIATTAKHFGMTVIGVNRQGQSYPEFDKVIPLTKLNSALPNADVIASVLPHTPDTQGLLNKQMLGLLKPDAILFNLGRGSVLDLDALAEQLPQQPNQLAILDVFEHEPLNSSHPIWLCPNAIITPHIAAPSFPEQVVEIFSQNYKKWSNNQPLSFQVDFKRGYWNQF